MVRYTNPGKYVALCPTDDMKGHFIRVFEMPKDAGNIDALTYFKLVVDTTVAVDAVYPRRIFRGLYSFAKRVVQKGGLNEATKFMSDNNDRNNALPF